MMVRTAASTSARLGRGSSAGNGSSFSTARMFELMKLSYGNGSRTLML
jgi:hypothetical protein